MKNYDTIIAIDSDLVKQDSLVLSSSRISQYLLLLTFFLPAYGYSATYIYQQPFLKQISKAQGLSQNTVNSIYQDETGFIWLSTEAGLNRFDGKQFVTFEDTFPEIANHSINSLTIDKTNNLWISSSQGLGFVSADRSKHQLIQFPSEDKYQSSANMVVGSEPIGDDNILVFTWNGIYTFLPNKNDISQPAGMSEFHSESNNLLSYIKDGDRYWIGATQGLYLFDSKLRSLKKISIQQEPSAMRIDALLHLDNEQILIGGNKGLFLVNLADSPIPKAKRLSQSSITGLTKINHSIYFSNWEEIGQVDISTESVSLLFNLASVLPIYDGYLIRNIFIDSNGLLWIGTRSQGVYLWDTRQHAFERWSADTANANHKLSNNSIWSIDKINQSDLLIGTDSGLDYYDFDKDKIFNLISNKNKTIANREFHVFDLTPTNESYWLATNQGLVSYELKTKKVRVFSPSQDKQKKPFMVYSMAKASSNEIWLATNLGIFRFNPKNHSFEYDKRIMSDVNAMNTRFISFQAGFLWLGIQNKLVRYSTVDGTSTVIKSANKNILGNNYSVTDLKVTGNRVWVSYRGDGIYLIELSNTQAKLIHHFHTVSNFPDNNIFSLSLSKGFLWAGSTQGLIRIDIKTNQFEVFDHSDGLPSNEFNEGASLIGISGILYLGTPIGLIKIDPAKLDKKENTKAPNITQIKASNNDLTNPRLLWDYRSVALDDSQTSLTIRYTSINYLKQTEKEYQFWINNEDSKQTTRSQQLTLTGLPLGKNVFYIRSRQPGSTHFSKTLMLNISVKNKSWFAAPKALGNYIVIIAVFLLFLAWRQIVYRRSRTLNDKLKESEQRMELALLDARRGIWDCIIDKNEYSNSKFIIFRHEYEPRELSLRDYFNIIHPQEAQKTKLAWQQFITGESESFVANYRCFFDGRWIWNRVYGKVTAYHEDNSPKRATGIWTDINPEKKMEGRLSLYSHAFQSTQDIVIILDKELKITVANKAYENSTGFSSEDLVGKSMVDIAFTRFTKDETNRIKNLVNENKQWHGESSVPRKNAASFPVSIRVNVISENGIESGYVVVMNDISHLKNIQSPVLKTSFYDQTTGLPNKTLAFDHLRTLIKHCKLKQQCLSIIFFSIDHFEKIKNTLDTDSVNSLTIKICNRLLPYIQKDDIFARYDQETFIIVQLKHEEDESIHYLINQLLKEISKPFIVDKRNINITACAGISNYPEDGKNWSELVTKAETALTQTKIQGENLFKYYHVDNNEKAQEKLKLENRLTQALARHEMFLVFQPVVELKSLKTIELDINLRWKYSEDKIIYPAQFMPLAENMGLLVEISNRTVENAFISLSRWDQEGFKVDVNLNLSINYLLDTGTVDFIDSMLKIHSIRANSVFISLAEQQIGHKTISMAKIAEKLFEIGIGLILDGYGKGDSSIQNLQKLKFHSVKLDKNLVRTIGTSKFSDRVLQGVISLLNDIQIGSVAKGIETQQQLDFLRKQKCQYGQGYFFSDPLNENQIRQFLLEK